MLYQCFINDENVIDQQSVPNALVQMHLISKVIVKFQLKLLQ